MRVLHTLVSTTFAGVERYLCDVLPLLQHDGVEVELIGGAAPQLGDAMRAAGVPWRPAATRGQLARELVRTRRADVVHAHMTDAELVSFAASRASLLVCTRHFAAERGSGRTGPAVRRILRHAFAAQYAISDYVAGCTADATKVVRLGVPQAPQAALKGRRALVANRLEEEKATEVAVRGFLQSSLPSQGWTLDVIGDGSQRSALQQCFPDISFLGFQDVRTVLGDYDLLVAGAPAEPFGLIVAEAMAQGIPVAAARGGGHVELLGPDHPLLFEPGHVADAACRLSQTSTDLAGLGPAGRERQAALFTLTCHVERLTAEYDHLAGSDVRRRRHARAVV